MELRPGTPSEAGMLPERIDRARDLCAGWVKSGDPPSLVVLVARRGVVCLHEAFGSLGPDADAPLLRLDSVFPMASITKPMAATVVLQLVEDGLLGLNRPVVDYLPELRGEGMQDVLVHHLLTHTSGLDDLAWLKAHGSEFGDVARMSPEEYRKRIREVLVSLSPAAPPGEVMNYSVFGYMLLDPLIERASGRTFGRTFADLARERLFGPLGMADSWLGVPESVRPRIVGRPPDAAWARPLGPIPGLGSPLHRAIPNPAGGVYSTARDVAVFGQMFLNGGTYGAARILSRSAVAEMTRNQIPGIPVQFGPTRGREASYGYGWFVRTNEKWRYWDGSLQSLGEFHHQGAAGTLLWVDPPNEIVGVYLSVALRMTPAFETIWSADLFQNVVTSAVG